MAAYYTDAYGAMVSRQSTVQLRHMLRQLRWWWKQAEAGHVRDRIEGKGRQVRAELVRREQAARDEQRRREMVPVVARPCGGGYHTRECLVFGDCGRTELF